MINTLRTRVAFQLPRDLPPEHRQPGRRITLRGTSNLRDLGGYRAADGRTVRWGTLYRSDHLGRVRAPDHRRLRALHLATLVDFRCSAEKVAAPDRLPANHSIRVIELPIFENDDSAVAGAAFKARILRGDVANIDPAAVMTDAYRQLATIFTPVYRQFIDEVLAARSTPLLFHCSSGKDRTGLAAAIVLRLLGVPDEVILADYLRSKAYSLAAHRYQFLALRLLHGPNITALVRTLLGVEAAYLQAAFATIDDTYGSFEAYARDGLGLGTADITRLRDNLLEG